MAKFVINNGDKFKRLTVIKEAERGKYNEIRYLCLCDCGSFCTIKRSSIISDRTGSCGCLRRELHAVNAKIRNTTHGLSKHPLFNVWRGIKKRCYSKTYQNYRLYGERGVRMCEEWFNDFIPFYDWCMANGWRKGLQIDKDIIPYKLGTPPLLYSPEMCSIVTPSQNNNSRRGNVYAEINGVIKTAAEWGQITGIHRSNISQRIKAGITGYEAVYGVGSGNSFAKNKIK